MIRVASSILPATRESQSDGRALRGVTVSGSMLTYPGICVGQRRYSVSGPCQWKTQAAKVILDSL